MKKQLMTSIGNEKGYYDFSIKKNKDFFNFLSLFFKDLKIPFEIGYEIDGTPCNPMDNTDMWREYKNEKFKITLFYGYQNIIMIIRLKEKDKKIIRPLLDKYFDFLKPKQKEL